MGQIRRGGRKLLRFGGLLTGNDPFLFLTNDLNCPYFNKVVICTSFNVMETLIEIYALSALIEGSGSCFRLHRA